MKPEIIAEYIDKIYAFAVKKTFSEQEAEELSQEILLTALTAFPNLKDENRFEPWLWGVAVNTAKTFSRRMGRQRAMYVYNASESMFETPVLEDNSEELYSLLRRKIGMLSKIYREIIILHYYDGLSTKQIANQLNVPVGTVTWRLSEARHKLKKECTQMEQTALKPQKLKIDIYGSGDYNGKDIPFPNVFISDALSQNILALCYENPKSIEELSRYSGVPAYYIEERMENLIRRNAVIEPSKKKYQTDFVIYTDQHGKYCETHAQNAIASILEPFSCTLADFCKEAKKLDFYRAEKSDSQLNHLYSIMALDSLCKKYNNAEYPQIPANYDGQKWRYLGIMENGTYQRIGIGRQTNLNMCGTYQHHVFAMKGFGFRTMMPDYYINICESILSEKPAPSEFHLANTIKDGYILQKNEKLTVTVPAFTIKQKAEFDQLTDRFFSPLMPEYCSLVAQFLENYKKLFPAHVSNDVKRLCHDLFLGFYNTISAYCIKKGVLDAPNQNWICDVLIQWKN